jgi:hypothetical protein
METTARAYISHAVYSSASSGRSTSGLSRCEDGTRPTVHKHEEGVPSLHSSGRRASLANTPINLAPDLADGFLRERGLVVACAKEVDEDKWREQAVSPEDRAEEDANEDNQLSICDHTHRLVVVACLRNETHTQQSSKTHSSPTTGASSPVGEA